VTTQVKPWTTWTARMAKKVEMRARSIPGRAASKGVVLPTPLPRWAFIMRSKMYLTDMPMTMANLEAENPLLLAGLERAAELANIQVVADKDSATLSLRSAGSGLPHPRLDIVIDFDRIVISISQRPSHSSWRAIYSLLSQLAGNVQHSGEANEADSAPE